MTEAATPYSRLAGVYDELVVDPCYSQWAVFLENAWAGDEIRTVLDVCCGTGLMTEELVRRGLQVVGIDASREMLARAHGLLGSAVELRQVVLPDVPPDPVLDGPFDAAVSTLDGLNYLTLPQFEQTVARVAERLRPGGWFVFDVHAEPALPFMAENALLSGEEDGTSFTLTTAVDHDSRAVTTTIVLTASDPADSFTETHVQYVHSTADIAASLARAGLSVVSVTDEYTDEPVTASSLRATWVARRVAAS